MSNKSLSSSMEVDNATSHPIMVRHIGPRDIVTAPEKGRIWKRVAVVTTLGALFGFAASFLLEAPKTQHIPPVENNNLRKSPVVIVPAGSEIVKQTVDTSSEVAKLKTRNRRLEALVQVLQQRAQTQKNHPGPKSKN